MVEDPLAERRPLAGVGQRVVEGALRQGDTVDEARQRARDAAAAVRVSVD